MMVCKFFNDVKNDLYSVKQNKDHSGSVRNARIRSVGCRITGAALGAFAGLELLLGYAAWQQSSLGAVPLFAAAGLCAVLAHDSIRVGLNIKNLLDCFDKPPSRARPAEVLKHLLDGGVSLAVAATQAATGECPIGQGTLLLKPFVKLHLEPKIFVEWICKQI